MMDTSSGVWNIPRDGPVSTWQDVPPNHSFRKSHVRTRAPWAQWYMNVVPLLGSPVCRDAEVTENIHWGRGATTRTPAQTSQTRREENNDRGRRAYSCRRGLGKGPCITMPTICWWLGKEPLYNNAYYQLVAGEKLCITGMLSSNGGS